eukprot:5675912-Prymnesium_polylepis.1
MAVATDELLSLTKRRGRTRWVFLGEEDDADAPVALRRIEGAGIGVVARRALTPGERVFAEAPCARLSNVVWAARADAESEVSLAERLKGVGVAVCLRVANQLPNAPTLGQTSLTDTRVLPAAPAHPLGALAGAAAQLRQPEPRLRGA